MGKGTLKKFVITVIILEILIGAIYYGYKKLGTSSDGTSNLSLKDKTVTTLYKKIAHEDLEILDVMENKAMLYYAYWNIDDKETINCEVVDVKEDGYTCDGLVTFVKKNDLEKAVKNLYGKDITVQVESFEVDKKHYAVYDETHKGVVVFSKEDNSSPINIKLKSAVKDEDKILLTTQILDGIYGTIKETYQYTFVKNGKDYYLTKKEKVKA